MKYNPDKVREKLLAARLKLPHIKTPVRKCDEEGGCGVTGFIASVPVRGRHIYEPSVQMHNRGNGKGGGIAAIGLSADDLGVSQDILESHYLLQVAYIESNSRNDVESTHIEPVFDIHHARKISTIDHFKDIGLEVKPPDVWQYFVKVKKEKLLRFAEENSLTKMETGKIEDEFIYQNTVQLNQTYYASLGDKKAFVMSHGRNMMILKIVGYAEQVTQYYCLDDFKAHGWIAHQRYPTRGRLWHPGGAHPFSGMHEALVHNGDFANYHAVSEYLNMHNIYPQFLTDTEVSVLLFDLYNRVFGYPMEYIIEALAPTTEHDFDQLTVEKQKVYRAIQSQHVTGSPDGPWLFIIARNDPYENFLQLIGITDTAMLRPQVFALQEGKVQIGMVCSEKQAIDATLKNLSEEDDRFCPVADKYWSARGGSATDGGAFMFTLKDSGNGDGTKKLVTTNKFGETVQTDAEQFHFDASVKSTGPSDSDEIIKETAAAFNSNDIGSLINYCTNRMKDWDYTAVQLLCSEVVKAASQNDANRESSIDMLTYLNNRVFPTGSKKRSAVLNMVRNGLKQIFDACPELNERAGSRYASVDFDTRKNIRPPEGDEKILVVNAEKFQPEGEGYRDSRLLKRAYKLGWNQYICYEYKGQRFTGCGFGKNSESVRIDVYDSSGDYLASGIDGMEIHVHDNGQDQLGQIMKQGKLVIHGDVGQTFMYGAKGGDVYVLGNAAGRPLINGTGKPHVVINGTCLDYLAESFMAGDPLNGGGFVVINGLEFNEKGKLLSQNSPYPGSNIFSLASGGAIYIRDPHHQIVDEQLNGGEIVDLNEADWNLILPYLQENEKQFGISVKNDLLMVGSEKRDFSKVYRKVQPRV